MRESSCRRTGGLIDKVAAGIALGPRDVEHAAACGPCRDAAEQAAWLEHGLERVVPSLVTETIPPSALEAPSGWWSRRIPGRWRPILTVAAAVGVIIGAVVIGGQIGALIGRTGIGGPVGPEGGPLASATGISLPRSASTISCGTPSGLPGSRPVEDLDDLGNLPRVAMQQEDSTVTSLFARPGASAYEYALCIWFTDHAPPVSSGASGIGVGVPADGPLRLLGVVRGSAGGEWRTAYAGSVAAEVVRVLVERSDGESVDAAVMDGYFLASWSGDVHAARFTALGEDGRPLASIGNNGWDFREQPWP